MTRLEPIPSPRSRASRLGCVCALSCLALAGCAGSRLSTGNHSTFYGPSVVSYATSDGTMPLVVHGTPYPMPQDEAAAVIARNFQLPGWFQPATFEPVPVEQAGGLYRVVLAFSPDTPVPADTACSTLDQIPVQPPDDEVAFRAAFCAGDYVVSDLFGRTPSIPPDSPAFLSLLGQISYTLFPSYNPTLRDDEDRFFFLPFGPIFRRD